MTTRTETGTTLEIATEPKADLTVFRNNLIHLMNQKGIRDAEALARELKVDKARVKMWLQAVCFPKHAMMIRICNYFKFHDYCKLITQPIEAEPGR